MMEEYTERTIPHCLWNVFLASGDGLAGTVEAKTRCHVTPVSSTPGLGFETLTSCP